MVHLGRSVPSRGVGASVSPASVMTPSSSWMASFAVCLLINGSALVTHNSIVFAAAALNSFFLSFLRRRTLLNE